MTIESPGEFTDNGIDVLIDYEGPIQYEPVADSDVTPGAVVELTTADTNKCQEASADSERVVGYAGPNTNADDPSFGTRTDKRTDFSSSDNERVPVRATHGDKFWGILADQSGSAVEPGTKLKAAAGGELTPVAADGTESHLAVAELLGTSERSPDGSSTRAPMRWIK